MKRNLRNDIKLKSPRRAATSGSLEMDPEFQQQGGWKLHLTIGPVDYEKRVLKVKAWLQKNINGEEGMAWKYRTGGDRNEKDFTIYCGSCATMLSFVRCIENDPIGQLLDVSRADGDRLVGEMKRIGARFDLQNIPREGWQRGVDGIPFLAEDKRQQLASGNRRELLSQIAQIRKQSLKRRFGDYFLPEDWE